MTERDDLIEQSRRRIRGLATHEVQRRGRRRRAVRNSSAALLLLIVGVVGLQQSGLFDASSSIDNDDNRHLAGNETEQTRPKVQWVNTDWSIGDRTSARQTGMTRWVSNADTPSRIERVGTRSAERIGS